MDGKNKFEVVSSGCWTKADGSEVQTGCPGRIKGGSVIRLTG